MRHSFGRAQTDLHTGVTSVDPSEVNVYLSPTDPDPLRCSACGGRIGGWSFTLGDGVAYHTEHDPNYAPPTFRPRTRRGRFLMRFVR